MNATRLELIDMVRIHAESGMEQALKQNDITAEEYTAITQIYLLVKVLDKLEEINKSLNLISMYTRGDKVYE